MQPGDLTQLATVKAWLAVAGLPIASITQASPAVVTLQTRPQIPLLSGATYTLDGLTGMASINGEYVVTVIDPTSFSVPVDTTAIGPYTGGGVVAVSDPLLARLISSCSTFFQSALNRQIANAVYTETVNGNGASRMLTPNYPITDVMSVSVDGVSIPPRPALNMNASTNFGFTFTGYGPAGYTFDFESIMLSGYCFTRGWQNVTRQYAAGFLVPNEAQTVPATGPYTLSPIAHWSAGDRGVTYANGTALTRVSGVPSVAGQYAYSNGAWTFSAADAGAAVLLSYGYVPFDVEQAVVDMIGDWFQYRARIGKKTEGIEGQSTSFVDVPMPSRAKGVWQQYNRVAPI